MRTVPFIVGIALALGVVVGAVAQTFPNRPVKLLIPFPPGGPTDVIGRLLAQEFSRIWPHNMVVENRGGAGGLIGTEAVAKAAPDGHTVLHATMAANAVAPTLYAKVPYDTVRDFIYVAPFVKQASVLLINSRLPPNTLKELIEYVRANKGKLTYASPGIGLSGHLGMEMILRATGMEVLHVPYKGAAAASQAVVAGETDLTLDPVPTAINYIKSGKAKAIAITSEARASQLPDTPTLIELGYPGLIVSTWQGMAVPAGTPKEIVAQLYQDLQRVKNAPDVRERFARMGAEVFDLSPEQFSQFVREESRRWGEVVKQVGAKVE